MTELELADEEYRRTIEAYEEQKDYITNYNK